MNRRYEGYLPFFWTKKNNMKSYLLRLTLFLSASIIFHPSSAQAQQQCDDLDVNIHATFIDDCSVRLLALFDYPEGSIPFGANYTILNQAGDEIANFPVVPFTTYTFTTSGEHTILFEAALQLSDGTNCSITSMRQVQVDCGQSCEDLVCNILYSVSLYNQVVNTINQTDECGGYQITIPVIQECYNVEIDWGDGSIQTFDSSQLVTHDYENGSYELCISIVSDTGVECYRRCPEIIKVDCCAGCDDKYSNVLVNTIWNTFTEKDCDLYYFEIPRLDDCHEVQINWGDGHTSVGISGTTVAHEYTEDGEYEICVVVFSGNRKCAVICKTISVDCCTSCDTQTSQSILAELFALFSRDDCGTYSWGIPTLTECYSIDIDWGDGVVDQITSETTTAITHTYTSNGDYNMCVTIKAGDEICLVQCKTLNVDCCKGECDLRYVRNTSSTISNSITAVDDCGTFEATVTQFDPCYTLIIDWGDGTGWQEYSANSQIIHTYLSSGTFATRTTMRFNGDQESCYTGFSTNITAQVCAQREVNEIFISPNPTSSFFAIQDDSAKEIKNLIVYSNLGKIEAQLENITNGQHIDVSNFQPGNYYVTMMFEDGSRSTMPLVVTN